MKISTVHAIYFSPTGNTEKVALALAQTLAESLSAELKILNYTLPAARDAEHHFGVSDFVVFATPVYAGRIPNRLLPYVQTHFTGEKTPAMSVAVFGNRSYDNGLIELRNELYEHGIISVAGAGVVTEHVFSDKLATGRPDEADLAELKKFAVMVAEKVKGLNAAPEEKLPVRGDDPVGPYYVPKGTDGQPAKFLKAKPLTIAEKCSNCGICAGACPEGSISAEDCTQVPGICIKCQACIKKCPTHAKYMADEAFLSHVAMLEQNFARRTESEFFL